MKSEFSSNGSVFPFLSAPFRGRMERGLCLFWSVLLWAPATSLADSLWLKAENSELSMFADKKATRVGDIVTVLVDESSRMVNSLSTSSDKKSAINNKVTQFFFSPQASLFGTHNGELPATDITGDNSYEGGGEITNRQTITGRVSVSVIDRLPNRNLVLEGVRLVSYSGEKQYMVFRGIARPYDIGPGNTILSSAIAEAQVEVVTVGHLTKAQKKGWLTRLNALFNPF